MPFTLRIFESEFKEMENFVLQYENIETGGDLFGLWTKDADPVAQLIIGPGARCRRTSVSFHQDTDYLQNVGTYLNSSFMLCHIGSWHSHHQLTLTRPSAGDRSTVCNNFPRGLQRYIMIIANIECSTRTGAKYVVIHPYMFTSEGRVCEKGTVHIIPRASPFREDGHVLRKLCQGTEQNRVTSTFEHDNSTRALSPRKVSRRSPTKIESPPSFKASRNSLSDTIQQRNGYQENSEVKQWYNSPKGGDKLKKLNEQICRILKPESEIKFLRNSASYDLSLEFPHNGQMWDIEFPASFDEEPARIKRNSVRSPIYSSNIVEAIQKACPCISCGAAGGDISNIASLINRDVGTLQNRRSSSARRLLDQYGQVREKWSSGETLWHKTTDGKSKLETIQNQIHSFLSTYEGRSQHMVKLNTSSNGRDVSLTFPHDQAEWFIEFPKNFPESQARIYKKERGASKSFSDFLPPNDVIETLKRNCGCKRCAPRSYSRRRNAPSARYAPSRHLARDTKTADGRRIISANVTVNTNPGHSTVSNRMRTLRKHQQWYLTENGEKKLSKIHRDICSLILQGGKVDMSRSISKGDIRMEFDHNRRRWRIEFPSNYPHSSPEIGYYDLTEQYQPVSLQKKGILHTIRSNCLCPFCIQYSSRIY